ncbi:MAG: hypothetical protein ACP5PJ_06015, partial [Acidimicrobiales bacterium]
MPYHRSLRRCAQFVSITLEAEMSARSTKKKSGRPQAKRSGRYTPPTPQSKRKSPTWLLWALFGALGLGALLIIVNFLAVLPGGESSWYLL